MAALSLMLSEWGWRNESTANFYLAPMRAWELFAGSIAAFFVQKNGVQKNDILALMGLAAITFSIFVYDKNTPFPSAYTLVPVLGVVLLVLYADKETLVAKFLSIKILVGIGLISYSAYLWHQPLFAFAKIRIQDPAQGLFIILSFLSLCLAYLSWKYVENPFRGKNSVLTTRRQVFFSTMAALCAFSIIGYLGNTTNGYETATNVRVEHTKLTQRMARNYGMSGKCKGKGPLTTPQECTSSDTPKVLLWGDSLAMHLYQGISASKPSIELRQITQSSCSPILGISLFNPAANKGYARAKLCLDFNNFVFEWLEKNKSVEFVVLSSPFAWAGEERVIDEDGIVHQPDYTFALDKFSQTIAKIKSAGVGVALVSPTPRSGENIGKCLTKKYQFKETHNCSFSHIRSSYAYDFIDKASEFVPVYWLYKDICQDGVCYAEKENNFIYRDSIHLSQEGSAFLGKTFNWHEKLRALALAEDQMR